MSSFSTDAALVCSFRGCTKVLRTPYTDFEAVRDHAESHGWFTDEALNFTLCPDHRGGEGGVGALVPAIPPSRDPGHALVPHRFTQPMFPAPSVIPRDRPRVLVGV